MKKTRIKIALFEFQNAALRKILKLRFYRPDSEKLVFLGNKYSGYWFPENLINSKGTVWGVGLGMDSSFEVEMLKNGFSLLGFEPEIKCYEEAKLQLNHANATVYNFGIWDKTGSYAYTGENFSLVDIFQKGDFHPDKFEIKSLWEVTDALQLEKMQAPRVLRMNIEGAEREILKKFCNQPLAFEVIIFQAEFMFHLPFLAIWKRFRAFRELNQVLKKFRKSQWLLVGLNRHQFTLISKL